MGFTDQAWFCSETPVGVLLSPNYLHDRINYRRNGKMMWMTVTFWRERRSKSQNTSQHQAIFTRVQVEYYQSFHISALQIYFVAMKPPNRMCHFCLTFVGHSITNFVASTPSPSPLSAPVGFAAFFSFRWVKHALNSPCVCYTTTELFAPPRLN